MWSCGVPSVVKMWGWGYVWRCMCDLKARQPFLLMVMRVHEPALPTHTRKRRHTCRDLTSIHGIKWSVKNRSERTSCLYKQPNAIQMFHVSHVPMKSAHVSPKWQNIATLKWYTPTEARTSVHTASAAALWLWSGVKMSHPLCIFIVHFSVFAWVPSQWKWAMSLYFYAFLVLGAGDQLLFLQTSPDMTGTLRRIHAALLTAMLICI